MKPTSVGVPPLCRSSGQPPHTHTSWPFAQLRLIRSICTFSSDAEVAEKRSRAKFVDNGVPFPIKPLKRFRHVHPPAVRQTKQSMWLPIPYHRDMANGIKSPMFEVSTDPTMNQLYMTALGGKHMPMIRPAWKSDGIEIWESVRKNNIQVLSAS